jgi:hypothetical protein
MLTIKNLRKIKKEKYAYNLFYYNEPRKNNSLDKSIKHHKDILVNSRRLYVLIL